MDSGSLGLNRGGGHWNPLFLRPLNDWDVDKVEDLFSRLQRKVVDSVREDKMVWMNLYNNKYSIKHLYATLELWVLISFPKRVVWNLWVPSKVNFLFLWEATWGKVLVLD